MKATSTIEPKNDRQARARLQISEGLHLRIRERRNAGQPCPLMLKAGLSTLHSLQNRENGMGGFSAICSEHLNAQPMIMYEA